MFKIEYGNNSNLMNKNEGTLAKEIYKQYAPAGQGKGVLPIVTDGTVLEIGFGSGELLKELRVNGNDVYGTDVGKEIVQKAKSEGFKNVFLVDASEEPMPFNDNFFDAVYCYEVFEHLANPHRLFYEIRRVLKPDHNLFFSVPEQERSMGYGPSRHAFVYPGLLEKTNLERFFMQMYFKVQYCKENEEGIIHHRNYILKNIKLDLPDILEVIVGDYSICQLYEGILSPENLKIEIERELKPYIKKFEKMAQNGNWKLFENTINSILPYHSTYWPFYVQLSEISIISGNTELAKNLLARLVKIPKIPQTILDRVSKMILKLTE